MEALEALFAALRAASTRLRLVPAPAQGHGADRLRRPTARWPSATARTGGAGRPSYRRPDGAGVARLPRGATRARVALPRLAAVAARRAARARRRARSRIINDLPIGLDVAGADAWCWQDLLARDVSVGAPPDEFNADGQDWGLTPFIPHRLRAARLPAVHRDDPRDARARGRAAHRPRDGPVPPVLDPARRWAPRAAPTCARAPTSCWRSSRWRASARSAFIVGEDLGTVEPGVRETAARRTGCCRTGCSTSSPSPPRDFPELALSSVTTHDLPTIAGLWTGADVEAQRRHRPCTPTRRACAGCATSCARLGHLDDDAPRRGRHRAHATARSREAPSRVLLATLDDALAVPERPNMPGTVTRVAQLVARAAAAAGGDREMAPLPRTDRGGAEAPVIGPSIDGSID